MKRLMNILVVGLMALAPLTVNAAGTTQLNFTEDNCVLKEGESNVYVCTISATTTGEGVTELTIGLTAENATINFESIEGRGEWMTESTSSPLTFTSLSAQTGTYEVFSFEYTKATDGTNCKVKATLNGTDYTINNGDDKTPTDTPTENKQTGVTLPYIVLGGAVILAVVGYVSVKNKSKMYKI